MMESLANRVRMSWVHDTRFWDSLRVCKALVTRRRGWLSGDDALRVVRTLESEGIPFWLSGGWGIDALVGRRTRMHGDLDVILGDYDRDELRACHALAASGFAVTGRTASLGMWPHIANLADGGGRRVELHDVNWPRLSEAAGWQDACHGVDVSGRDLCAPAFTEGTINGCSVPCLSALAQVVTHSGYRYQRGGRCENGGRLELAILEYKKALSGQVDRRTRHEAVAEAIAKRDLARLYGYPPGDERTPLVSPAEQAIVEARLREMIERRLLALESLVAPQLGDRRGH